MIITLASSTTHILFVRTMPGARLVADVIDFEQRDEGMMVAHGICDQLDDMKHQYAGLPDFLTRVSLLRLQHCCSASRGT